MNNCLLIIINNDENYYNKKCRKVIQNNYYVLCKQHIHHILKTVTENKNVGRLPKVIIRQRDDF